METALDRLRTWSLALAKQLSETAEGDTQQRSALIQQKADIDLACKRLLLCERWNIHPRATVRRLPTQSLMGSEYRLMDDRESDAREYWVEADFDGRIYRPSGGDLLIQMPE